MRLLLEPPDPRAYPKAVQAILAAELIIVGPGSLYTSILPNLLVPEIANALRASHAPKVYICNIATQAGETETYTAEEHLQALETHLGRGLFSVVVVNEHPAEIQPPEGTTWVEPALQPREGLRVVQTPLGDNVNPWQHDSEKLARTIMALLK